jgi:hypothetical protein
LGGKNCKTVCVGQRGGYGLGSGKGKALLPSLMHVLFELNRSSNLMARQRWRKELQNCVWGAAGWARPGIRKRKSVASKLDACSL